NGNLQGGSTITQQLIRSSMLTPEQSIIRKIKEIILAYWTEKIYSKQQILEMYFNQIPYGGTAWGANAASYVYFGTDVKNLTLAQSAFLAGITAAPTRYSPYGADPSLWKSRQKEVLQRMVSLGFITQPEARQAETQNLKFQSQEIPIHAPHFVMYVKNLLIQTYGLAMVEHGGLTVRTSLDLPTQNMAEAVVTEEVQKAELLKVGNGAAVVTDPKTGDILAMVGSKSFSDTNGGNVNITTALRQPGSAIKVVTYAAALTNGFTSASILDDSPVTYQTAGSPPYKPVNYNGQFFGRMPLRLALANSLNIPAVKVLNQIGIPTMVKLGIEMGINNWNETKQYGLSITLGGAEVSMLDLTTVYATLANKGTRIDLNPLIKVTDDKEHVLFVKKEPKGEKVLPKGLAFILSHILADNNARTLVFGINSPLVIPNHTVSVKTGTSDNKRDNWTVGYTDNYVVTAWVGNNDNSPMSQELASGITGAAPIWNKIMTQLLEKHHEQPLTPPGDIVVKPCFGKTEYFLKGTEDNAYCSYPPTPTPVDSQSTTQPTPTPAPQQEEKRQNDKRPRPFQF
ncbi:MAG: transglycosylase domain-containing protein, partial [Candidatus Levybacteria bacterium]|nr:transglycosylase domain-containing protein [Candidatus Levybacteria bacterium]